MKITIVQGAFLPVPPLRGGAVEKMWFLLGREFAKRGHEVVHVSRTFPGQPAEEVHDGVRRIRLKGYDTPKILLWLKWLDLLYTLRVMRHLGGGDIVVGNTFWLPVLYRGARRGKMVVDVQRMPKGQMRLYRNAARLRANSLPVERAILEDDRAAEGRTCMIPNPLTFLAEREPAWEKKERVILYAGRIHPEKGIDVLLKAFALARCQGLVGWELRLVGPWDVAAGGGGDAWLEDIKATNPQAGVSWVGPLYEAEDLNLEYDRATLFAYPSLAEKGETFGLAPLEAMAWGCVPLVSDLACFKDFIRSGVNGLVFDHRGENPSRALAALLCAAVVGDLGSMAKCAVKVRDTHSVVRIADEFLLDFKSILHKHAADD